MRHKSVMALFVCSVLILLVACVMMIIPTPLPDFTPQPSEMQQFYVSLYGCSLSQFDWHTYFDDCDL